MKHQRILRGPESWKRRICPFYMEKWLFEHVKNFNYSGFECEKKKKKFENSVEDRILRKT